MCDSVDHCGDNSDENPHLYCSMSGQYETYTHL